MKEWHCYQTLPTGAQWRLGGFESKLGESQVPVTGNFFHNLAQYAHYMFATSSNLPTLLRRSQVWSTKKRRLLTAEEYLEAQGLPIFTDPDAEYQIPFRQPVWDHHFTSTELKSMAGNAMHLPTGNKSL